MEPTTFTIKVSRPEDDGRTLIVYQGSTPTDYTLMAMDHWNRVDRFIEIFFWDGPENGVGRRDAVATISLNRKGTEAEISVPSFHVTYTEELVDYLGALRIAGEWFSLLKYLAGINQGELVRA